MERTWTHQPWEDFLIGIPWIKRAMIVLSALILLHFFNIWNVKATDLCIKPCLRVQADLDRILCSLFREGTWLFCAGQPAVDKCPVKTLVLIRATISKVLPEFVAIIISAKYVMY